jgi:hypothetical protein
MQAAPRLYPGMEATLHGYAGRELSGTASVRLFLRPYDDAASLIYTEPLTLNPGHYVSMTLKAPREAWPIRDFGIEINGHGQATGPFYVDSVRFTGTPFTIFPDTPLLGPAQEPVGWINDLDQIIIRPFPADRHPCFRIGKNSGTGVMVTGTRDWNDYTFEATLSVNRAARAGLIVRYQGLRRYVAVVRTSDRLQLIQNFYGETALDEIPVSWQTGEEHTLTVRCEAGLVRVWLDGEAALGGQVAFLEGGAGFLVDQGLVAVRGAAAYDVGTGFKSAPERNVP